MSPGPLADLITKTVIDSDGINVMIDTTVTAADAGTAPPRDQIG